MNFFPCTLPVVRGSLHGIQLRNLRTCGGRCPLLIGWKVLAWRERALDRNFFGTGISCCVFAIMLPDLGTFHAMCPLRAVWELGSAVMLRAKPVAADCCRAAPRPRLLLRVALPRRCTTGISPRCGFAASTQP